jgi:hypothetical protein
MQGVLDSQELLAGAYVRVALPAALLFGGLVLWRMAGHLYNRTQGDTVRSFGFAFVLALSGAMFTESISWGTSMISLSMGINKMVQTDIAGQTSTKAADSLSAAATHAAKRLTDDLANTPDNYRTQARKTTEALTELLQAQEKLASTTATTAIMNSPTERTFNEIGGFFGLSGDRLKYTWAALLALGLSFIPLAGQFCLGATSDGGMARREDDSELEYMDMPKKSQRSAPRATSAKKRAAPAAKKPAVSKPQIELRDPMGYGKPAAKPVDPVIEKSVQALQSLGFKRSGEARQLVESAEGDTPEVRIRNALRASDKGKPEPRRMLPDIVKDVERDIESGKLQKVTVDSLAAYSNSRGTRQGIIDALVKKGVLSKGNNGRVNIAA